MYKAFYSMTRNPFVCNIPGGSIYRNDTIDNALNRLEYACRHKQFAILIGPHGSGKTTLIRTLSEKLDSSEYLYIYMDERALEPRLFYNRILSFLGYTRSYQFTNARITVQRELEKQGNRKLVVVIDSAEMLSYDMLDEIRFALNYKMDTEKPFALILSATGDILRSLRKPYYSSTLNRIEMNCFLSELTKSQTRDYIKHQLEYSGCTSEIFTGDAVSEIYSLSKGSPIQINRICDTALKLGAQREYERIDSEVVVNVWTNEMINTEVKSD